MKPALLAVLALLSLTGCKTPTGFGVTLDVPLFGHLEAHTDPVKAVADEAKPVTDAVGLTAPATGK